MESQDAQTIKFCILLEVSAGEKESPSSARPLLSAMTRIPAVASTDGATGAFLKACLVFQTSLIPPVSTVSMAQRRKLLHEASCVAEKGRLG